MNKKIKTKKELKKIIEKLKKEGKRIVTTNGAFDLIHVAHLNLLEKAKSLGDVLIVLINSDASVKRLKGKKRPIFPQRERAMYLSYLLSVDFITIFSEDKPLSFLKYLKPDVHVKGGSFVPERIKEEKGLLESWGGEFKTFKLEEGYSSTNIIQTILDRYKNTNEASKQCPKEPSRIFNRNLLKLRPLSKRISKSDLSIMIDPDSPPPKIDKNNLQKIKKLARLIKQAKKRNKPIILAFGAHLIKNGLSLITIELMKSGFITQLATSGASTIHDWELAYQGKTEEDVKKYVQKGQFGLWEETGKYINLAISQNRHLGYGKAIGKLIYEEKLGGQLIPHPYKSKSIFSKAYELGVPTSVCPGIGYDIIYTHPLCNGATIGEASYIDFLKFVNAVSGLEGGVYISVGSAITSPMIFEKALSMAKNLAIQDKTKLENYTIAVNDIKPTTWNWSKGEPPKDNPAYYSRFNKTFSRMGGDFDYIQLDNRAFLHNLYALLI